MPVAEGDRIGTTDGRAEIYLGKKNYLRLDQNTKIDFLALPKKDAELIRLRGMGRESLSRRQRAGKRKSHRGPDVGRDLLHSRQRPLQDRRQGRQGDRDPRLLRHGRSLRRRGLDAGEEGAASCPSPKAASWPSPLRSSPRRTTRSTASTTTGKPRSTGRSPGNICPASWRISNTSSMNTAIGSKRRNSATSGFPAAWPPTGGLTITAAGRGCPWPAGLAPL